MKSEYGEIAFYGGKGRVLDMQKKDSKGMYGYGYMNLETEDTEPVLLASIEDVAKFVLSDTSNKVVTDNLGIFLFDTVGTLINTYSKLCDIDSLSQALIELNAEAGKEDCEIFNIRNIPECVDPSTLPFL